MIPNDIKAIEEALSRIKLALGYQETPKVVTRSNGHVNGNGEVHSTLRSAVESVMRGGGAYVQL